MSGAGRPGLQKRGWGDRGWWSFSMQATLQVAHESQSQPSGRSVHRLLSKSKSSGVGNTHTRARSGVAAGMELGFTALDSGPQLKAPLMPQTEKSRACRCESSGEASSGLTSGPCH